MLAAGSPAHILWVKGSDGTTEYIDPRGVALLGGTAASVCGADWVDLLHPEDADEARREWETAARQRRSYEIEERIRDSAGRYRVMLERGSPVFDRDGVIQRWAGTLTDIEIDREARLNRERSQAEASVNKAFLDTLQSSAPIGVLFVDRHFRYLRVNEKVAAIHGSLSVEGHIGRTVAEVVPHLWAQLETSYRSVIATGEPKLNIELVGNTAEDPGREHSWLESIYPVRVDGEIIGLGVAMIDITARRKSELALAALTEAAVDAIAAAAEARDPYTAGHQRRVSELSVAIAKEIGVEPHEIEGVRIAAKIHDIGKLRMPSEILNKPGVLRDRNMPCSASTPRRATTSFRGSTFRGRSPP